MCLQRRSILLAYAAAKPLNTGGMGTFAPAPFYGEKTEKEVLEKIMLPTVNAMNAEGRTFKGVLYFGLMKTKDGMKVIEYNARFGDPETQVILPMLKTDLMEIFEAVTDERLADIDIEWETGSCVCVVLASGGYPESYEKGKEPGPAMAGKCAALCAWAPAFSTTKRLWPAPLRQAPDKTCRGTRP